LACGKKGLYTSLLPYLALRAKADESAAIQLTVIFASATSIFCSRLQQVFADGSPVCMQERAGEWLRGRGEWAGGCGGRGRGGGRAGTATAARRAVPGDTGIGGEETENEQPKFRAARLGYVSLE